MIEGGFHVANVNGRHYTISLYYTMPLVEILTHGGESITNFILLTRLTMLMK